jgi:hypothetical protein
VRHRDERDLTPADFAGRCGCHRFGGRFALLLWFCGATLAGGTSPNLPWSLTPEGPHWSCCFQTPLRDLVQRTDCCRSPSRGCAVFYCLLRCCRRYRSCSAKDVCCLLSGVLLVPLVDAVSQTCSAGTSGHYRSSREYNAACVVVLALALPDVLWNRFAVVEGMPFRSAESALALVCCVCGSGGLHSDSSGLLADFGPVLGDCLAPRGEVCNGFCEVIEGLRGWIRRRGLLRQRGAG